MPFLHPISQITVLLCFVLLIIVLFFDEQDYLTFSVLFLMVSTIVTAFDMENPPTLEEYLTGIDWQVILFLISMFTIVEILNEAHVFYTIAQLIIKRFHSNIRIMYYLICIVSTILASILEDLSIAIIFIPIIIITCQELKTNPAPFLYGMTICINLASTLTPFGSAENIMIANEFQLPFSFFLSNIGIYFVVTMVSTLVLLDIFILRKTIDKEWNVNCQDKESPIQPGDSSNISNFSDERQDNLPIHLSPPLTKDSITEDLREKTMDKSLMVKNFIGLIIFILLLIFVHEIHVAGILGMLLFVFLNTTRDSKGRYHPSLSKYLRKVDYKLIYFFMCLFVLVFLMEYNGTISILEHFIQSIAVENIFLTSLVILFSTSLLSGFLDNAPVTIIFLPIIRILIGETGFTSVPILIAFILGINLGGNFLPQGSAADMMTLELSSYYCVNDVNYRRLTKIGGLFALFHIVLGIIYLAFIIYVYPQF